MAQKLMITLSVKITVEEHKELLKVLEQEQLSVNKYLRKILFRDLASRRAK